MGEVAHSGLSVAEFYDWVVGQEFKYELVKGAPVLMADANRRHDRISVNGQRAIANQLQGRKCQPFTSDTYIRIPATNTRRMADFGVDCGAPDDESLEAEAPALVVEILSSTTRTFDRNDKLEEYKTIHSLEYILLIDPDQLQVRLYQRTSGREWVSERISGLDVAVEVPRLELTLALADLYSGVTFRPRPMLVEPEEQTPGKTV